jgi:hypothetical protein
MGQSFTIAVLVLASAVILRFESRGTHDILLSRIGDSPNLEGQVPVCISPRYRVARLHPQALGSLFVASYESQGYGGGNRPASCTDQVGNTVSNSTYTIVCVSVAAGTSHRATI